jgi:hypothetical protein
MREPAWAAGVVTSCTEASLRDAMAGGGTVTFACDGTITLASSISNSVNTILDATGHQITISGTNKVQVFCVNSNVTLSISNLTIAKGYARDGPLAPNGGGGIRNRGGIVNLNGVTFNSNWAWSGGAIYNGGKMNLQSCCFINNVSYGGNSMAEFGTAPPVFGGAIFNAGSMNLDLCQFTGNSARGADGTLEPVTYTIPCGPGEGSGGAIYNSGQMTIDRTTLSGNGAGGGYGYYGLAVSPSQKSGNPGGDGANGYGGAICNAGSLWISRSTLCSNTVWGGAGGNGGTGYVVNNINSVDTGGKGGSGAGASGGALYGDATLVDCSILANTAHGGAGGDGGSGQFTGGNGGNGVTGTGGALCGGTLVNCTFASNSAQGGAGGNGGSGQLTGGNGGNGSTGTGGVLYGGGTLVNCTIASNRAQGGAGGAGGAGAGFLSGSGQGGNGGGGGTGIYCDISGGNLTNCTIAWNSSVAGTGGAGGVGTYGHQVAGSPGPSGSASGANPNGSLLNVLLFSNTPAGSNTFADPKLGPLADNGGPTWTMALLPGSPAIDAGSAVGAPPTDQRGFPRPSGVACDIGAYEWNPPSLTIPPPTQTAEIGTRVELMAQASTFTPATYQWFFNGNAITGCTNCFLCLASVQATNVGAYTVVVSNVEGVVTSSPAMLNVIPVVERRPVPGVKVAGEAGSLLNVDYANSLNPSPNWTALGSVTLTSTSQFCPDLTMSLPSARFYRAWQTGTPGVAATLNLNFVPAIKLTGRVGDSLHLDCINAIGPTNAWVTLDTVTLTNTSQLYFDVSAPGQPQRLYRIVPAP